jgi:sigma-B regulation protein RsbU (phosphoserine phosphatase)
MMPQKTLKLDLRATPEELMRSVTLLESFGRENQFDEKLTFGLMLALEECGANVIHHAYQDRPQERFCVRFEATDEQLTIEIRDTGSPFDPTAARLENPDIDPDDRAPGGWGIQLVRRYMDDIVYRRDGNENVLRMVKRVANSST